MNRISQKYIDSQEAVEIDKPKCIYVLLAEDKTVKVGITPSSEHRKRIIRDRSGKRIVDSFSTGFCSNACEIENELKKRLSYCKLESEWYKEDFDSVTTLAIYLFIVYNKLKTERILPIIERTE